MSKITTPPKLNILRLWKCLWKQGSLTQICPSSPNLQGKLAVVTGGNNGIGLETCVGLAERGAEILILARDRNKTVSALDDIECRTGVRPHFIPLDLSDLSSVKLAIEALVAKLAGRPIDILVANAGIATSEYSQSRQSYELSFAVNVLGHHVLIKGLYDQGLLGHQSRVIMLAGDIYFFAKECLPNSTEKGLYPRSKLGNLWWVKEFSKRYPEIETYAVHPGVVDSGLGGENESRLGKLRRRLLLISPRLGAQTSLMCATQNNLSNGGYYHNTMGFMNLPASDIAMNEVKSAQLWQNLEAIRQKFN